jgi:hypothetical protein
VSGRLAQVLVFAASAAILVLEILAGRLLAPYVGVTLETFTAVIGVVLAGIAVGTWQGGRLADRTDPKPLIPLALALGGALAIGSVPIIRILGDATLDASPVAVVILASAGFLLPSAVLSSVSPMVVKLRLRSTDETGAVVGRLSAIGTAGSLVGVFTTGFVFVAQFPITPVIVGVGSGLIVLGFVTRALLRPTSDPSRMAACVALAIAAGALTVVVPSRCNDDTTYYCARVEADPLRPSGRVLHLDDLIHTYIDLDDPTYLAFDYSRTIAATIDVMAPAGEPLDVVHIGGGGFLLPRYVEATRPNSTNVVLEVDPGVVEIARRELGLRTGGGIDARTGDGRVLLRALDNDSADLVVGDAFGAESVPWHLTTEEFVRDIDRVLRPGGVYALNLLDAGPLQFARAQLATMRAVFEHVTVAELPETSSTMRGDNYVLMASHTPLPVAGMSPAEVDRFIGDAQVLTDEYAPVDRLHTTAE